jgi:hypothetical protein
VEEQLSFTSDAGRDAWALTANGGAPLGAENAGTWATITGVPAHVSFWNGAAWQNVFDGSLAQDQVAVGNAPNGLTSSPKFTSTGLVITVQDVAGVGVKILTVEQATGLRRVRFYDATETPAVEWLGTGTGLFSVGPAANPWSVSGDLGLPVPPTFTVALLPAGVEGAQAYVSNGRKVGEGLGAGTGVPVYFSGGIWLVFATDTVVLA